MVTAKQQSPASPRVPPLRATRLTDISIRPNTSISHKRARDADDVEDPDASHDASPDARLDMIQFTENDPFIEGVYAMPQDTRELPHEPSVKSVVKQVANVTQEETEKKATTLIDRLKPLAGKGLMPVKQQYALDHADGRVVDVPLGPFAALVAPQELDIPVTRRDAFVMSLKLELDDDLARPADAAVMLQRIEKRVNVAGSISINSNAFRVGRQIGKTHVSVKFSSTTQAGAMLAALARTELAELTNEGALVAWKDKWSKARMKLSNWQGKPIEPAPIEPPTRFPTVLEGLPADVVEQLALGRDGTAGQEITEARLTEIVDEINARARDPESAGYTLSTSGRAITFQYSIGGGWPQLTLRCMTAADVQVMGAASRLLHADRSAAQVDAAVAAVKEWGWRRVGLVVPIEQPLFAHPQMNRDPFIRERSTLAMFEKVGKLAGIKVHGTAEASSNDLVISKDGKAQVVQLKASAVVMRDGKATARFCHLDKPYGVVVMTTGQIEGETRLWACVSTHEDRRKHGLNKKTLYVSLDVHESKALKNMEALVVFDKKVGTDGTWEQQQLAMHIAIVERVLTLTTTEQYDQLANLCTEVPARAVHNITEAANIATFLRLSGFKAVRGANYGHVDLVIETPEGEKNVQIKSVRADGNFWKIDFGRGQYKRDSFDFLVAVLGREGYWMIPMDTLVENRKVHTDGTASMTAFAAHKGDNHWTAQYWTPGGAI